MITPSSIALTGFITWALLLLVLMEVIRSQLVWRRNSGVSPQMRIFDILGKDWRQRALFVLTLVLVVLFASHPELRLLVPIIDALGVDLFLVLIAGQTWAYSKPFLHGLYRYIVLPTARRGYSAFIFFFGYIGSYVDANISTRFQRFVPAA